MPTLNAGGMKNKESFMYGNYPKVLGTFGEHKVTANEMMFYQYLPVKNSGEIGLFIDEDRIKPYADIIYKSCLDYMNTYGRKAFNKSYVYVTIKNMYQCAGGNSYNREGWHSDGFLTDDVNYIWCNRVPTEFNIGDFDITLEDIQGMRDMNNQAKEKNNFTYPPNTLLRLDQYVIHRVSETQESGMRAFLKVSISKDRYDLIGNSINEINKNWDMKKRSVERNVPQSKIT